MLALLLVVLAHQNAFLFQVLQNVRCCLSTPQRYLSRLCQCQRAMLKQLLHCVGFFHALAPLISAIRCLISALGFAPDKLSLIALARAGSMPGLLGTVAAGSGFAYGLARAVGRALRHQLRHVAGQSSFTPLLPG